MRDNITRCDACGCEITGDPVVVDCTIFLQDGNRVRIVEEYCGPGCAIRAFSKAVEGRQPCNVAAVTV